MSRKATVVAPSNIALIKYWGTRDTTSTLPFNPSLSMTLRSCVSRTTVSVLTPGEGDRIEMRTAGGSLEPAGDAFRGPVAHHLDRLRAWAGVDCGFRIATENSFPMGAGIASSASGFAALSLAVAAALGREITDQEASILARESGSGSAARSVMGGYVEWPGAADDRSAAVQVLPPEHWDLSDVIAIIDAGEKKVSSRQGHRLAETSPYFEARLRLLPDRLEGVRRSLRERDFDSLAPIVEEEAIDLHLIAMSSKPPVFYWQPGTLAVLERIRELRRQAVPVCATMDAGANVHLICPAEAEDEVAGAIESLPGVQDVIRDGVGAGPRETDEHLF